MNTVAIATPKKIAIAVMDLFDIRPMPQTPWPLVHPEPSLVPNPTRSPATTSAGIEASIPTGTPPIASAYPEAPSKSPMTKAVRHPKSPRTLDTSIPPTMPLIPAILPFKNKSIAAATPMSIPPKSPLNGVKSSKIASFIRRGF